MSVDLNQLRRHLRRQRRQLSIFEQRQAEYKVVQQLRQHPQFKSAQKVGLYLDAFGEIQTDLILKHCWKLGKVVYLPQICNMNQRLVWVKISAHQYQNKRFSWHPLGMQQAMSSRGLHVTTLDLIIMPLLAFDTLGSRVGMGGGFYDKTLATAACMPYRLGLAHEFQFSETPFIRQPWDQALDACITPKKTRIFKRS